MNKRSCDASAEAFDRLPAKAQRAILATAYRDFDSPASERLLPELQASIEAYGKLLAEPTFAAATNLDQALQAVDVWARQYQFDDADGSSFLPAEKYSNLALHLAAMYRGSTQRLTQATIAELLDRIQGARGANLFEGADTRRRTLPEAVKEVLNIDYNGRRAAETPPAEGGTDKQGNPVDADGKLITERVGSIEELTDADFNAPKRSVELPRLPESVDKAIGAGGKPVIIKKSIFEKNAATHKDLTPADSRDILQHTLYTPAIVGRTQPITRPHYWVAIESRDGKSVTVLEVSATKDNIEIVGWHKLDKKGLEKLKKQAEREDGQLLIQTSDEAAAALSTLPPGLQGKDSEDLANAQAAAEALQARSDAFDRLSKAAYSDKAFEAAHEALTEAQDAFAASLSKVSDEALRQLARQYAANTEAGSLVSEELARRQAAEGGQGSAERDAAEFPYTTSRGTRYRAAAIRTDGEGQRYVVQYEGETDAATGESRERRLTVKNAPAEATMAVFSPNGVIPMGYAARDAETGKWTVWGMDGKEVKTPDAAPREQRAAEAAAPLTPREAALRDALTETLRRAGLDVSTDEKEGQDVLDRANAEGEAVRESGRESRRRRQRAETNRAIEEATAFVTGKSTQEVRRERRARAEQRKEEFKEISQKVLSADFSDATLKLIDKYIDEATPKNPFGRRISQRVPQAVERSLYEGERAGAVDALFTRICESHVRPHERLSRSGRAKIKAKKAVLLEAWAKAAGRWHEDVSAFTDGKAPIGKGKDSTVYLSKDGGHVVKFSAGKETGKFPSDADAVALFNYVFPSSAYTILGYGKMGGKFVTILEQPLVDFKGSTPLTERERVDYMHSLGYEPINKERTAFSNGELVVADLQKSNIVKDAAGNIRVIDADVKLHTKDIGGKYTYPPVEADLPTERIREQRVSPEQRRKERQLELINRENPMLDDDHTGIRTVGDIKTLREAITEAMAEAEEGGWSEWASWPDITNEMLEEGLRTGKIRIYSSYAIKGGVFVTPSYEQALEYAGMNPRRVHSRLANIDSVAWINTDEGQWAPVRFFRTADGKEAYGFTVGGKIYLDPRIATAETPLHEYAHLWGEMLRRVNPEGWADVVRLMQGERALWDEVKRRYPELSEDADALAEEVLAHYSGRRGAERLRAEQERILRGEGEPTEKAAAVSALQKVKAALQKFWHAVADLLHIRFTRAEDVADRVMADMLQGIDPRKVGAEQAEAEREAAAIAERARANGTYMQAPNGRPTRLTERQWAGVRTTGFKQWFGDWEKAERIEKLRASKDVEVAYHGEYPLTARDAQDWMKKNLRGEYSIDDTGEKILLSKVGAEEVTSHSRTDEAHLKSISSIPEMLKNAIFIDEEANTKGNGKFDSYRYL